MNILRVIVDELPKSAIYCPMFEAIRFEQHPDFETVHIKCNILGTQIITNFFDYQNKRCPDCPFVLERNNKKEVKNVD